MAVEEAAKHGFSAVELWWPFPRCPEPADAEVDLLLRSLERNRLKLVGLNIYEGDRDAGDRGLLNDPSHTETFLAATRAAVELAARAECPQVTALYGRETVGLSIEVQHSTAAKNLAAAVSIAGEKGVTVNVEPVNRTDVPGYLVDTVASVIEVMDRVEAEIGVGPKCTYDVYHSVMSGEDPLTIAGEWVHRIGHVQIADAPGRGRPGTGSIPYSDVLLALRDGGYGGWVGLEYRPGTEDDFAWLTEFEEDEVLARAT